jgi:superfamily II DNA or RNA helicase/NADH:ubiquinone oxidoreductase subunit
MRVYNTGDAPGIGLEKRYDGIWQLIAKNKKEGLHSEQLLQTHFLSARQKRPNGKFSEWFAVSFEEVQAFLNAQDFVVRELSIEEIEVIHKKSECDTPHEELSQFVEEKSLIDEQQAIIENPISSLKEEFFATFLEKGCVPRRIQQECWDKFEAICRTDEKYKGIIQWATGTGKTIALLMLFVLTADKCRREHRIFRGLLIAPKNDIFDTIIHHIRKLSKWGIFVCEGHNAHLSSLHIPHDKPVLVTATHASLTDSDIWNKLPAMDIVHYDEVHRITGDEFYTMLKEKIVLWRTQYLTGTSATPKTCNVSQHKKIAEMFGNPLQILHKCDVDEAILEGWIAQPRFGVHVMPNTMDEIVVNQGITTTVRKPTDRKAIIQGFVNIVKASIQSKKDKGLWKGGKVIAYLPGRTEVCVAVMIAKSIIPDANIYTAVEDADASADDVFVSDKSDGTPRILFACERYREGSDIKGLEMTLILIGNTIGANIVLQVAGRALRNDYEGKEGWCVIVRPSEEGTTEDDVFDSIVLQIMEFIGTESVSVPSSAKIRQVVEKFFGSVAISGKVYDVEETVKRIQSLYVRQAFERSPPKEKYEVVRNLNTEMGITSKHEYEERKVEHMKYIAAPKAYFRESWVSWYHYLGVDTTGFPQTKADWIRVCKEMDLTSWEEYKPKTGVVLPTNPGEMYDDYDNWDKEFGIETEDHVW